MAERVIALPTSAFCQAVLLVLDCKNLTDPTVTHVVLQSAFSIMTSV